MTDDYTLRELLRSDVERDEVLAGVGILSLVARCFVTSRLQAVVLARLSHAAGVRSRSLGLAIRYLNTVLNGCETAAEARIGPGLALIHPVGVVIGPHVLIGSNCTIMQSVTLGDRGGSPTVGDDVFLGIGCVVTGPIELGDRARVGANSVVLKDVPRDEFWAGAPARMIGSDPRLGDRGLPRGQAVCRRVTGRPRGVPASVAINSSD